jgi:uncharacterized SAM-binding protein YcdF (DUF218 family)
VYVHYKYYLQILLWPELWIFACVVGAWVASFSPRRSALVRWLLFVGILLFYLLGITPTGAALLRPLEWRYAPFREAKDHSYEAVVVLSGEITRQPQTGTTTILGTQSLDRLVCGIRLVRNRAAPILVLAGGRGDPFGSATPPADTMREFAIEFGIPPSAILTESRSRFTSESAVEVRRMLPDTRRIVLVTAASHLPRSAAVFRKQGFDVAPYPCTYLTSAGSWAPLAFFPNSEGFALVTTAIHEYVGLAAYRVMGDL